MWFSTSVTYIWVCLHVVYIAFFHLHLNWLDKFLLYMITGQDISFLVPDLCRAMVRNDKFISADVTEETIENYACFCYFQIIWYFHTDFVILKDKHNRIHCLKKLINLNSLRNRMEKLARGLFLKLVQINFMIGENVLILSIYSLIILESCHSFDHQCLLSNLNYSENCLKLSLEFIYSRFLYKSDFK